MEQNTYKVKIMEYVEKIEREEILKKIYTVAKTYYEFLEESGGKYGEC